jgi:hypothetical protein
LNICQKKLNICRSKGISDFKNSKDYWNFYKASIRVKSDIPE